MNTTFIYALCDPITFEVRYIGKTDNVYKRYYEHIVDRKSTHKVHWVKSLINQGVLPIYQVLEECDNDNWQERERNWISFYKEKVKSNLTNLTDGGDGILNVSIESRIKMSKALKGRVFSKETKKKMSESHKGKTLSEITKKRLSEANIGKHSRIFSEETKRKLSEAHRNPSLEKRINMSEAHKGKIPSKETRQKMSDSYNKHSKETAKKISKANMKHVVSKETKKKMSDAKKGKPLSEQHKKNLRKPHVRKNEELLNG